MRATRPLPLILSFFSLIATVPAADAVVTLTIDKTASPINYSAVGQVISYSYVVTNTGDETTLGGVTVDDDLADDESCPAGVLPPGAANAITCTATYTITAADLVAGSVTNVAVAESVDQDESPVTSPPDSATVFVVTSDVGFSKAFLPATIGPGSTTQLRFFIDNSDSEALVTDIAFTDVLPAEIVIANPASASTDCIDGVLSAPDGSTTISLTGARLAANSACSVTVNVTSSAPGQHQNVSGNLTSSAGSSGAAVATLTVDGGRPGFSKSFDPPTISLGATSTLTLTIDFTAAGEGYADFLSFVDPLPPGMVIATPANASTDCSNEEYDPLLIAVDGTNVISLTGGVVMAGGSCTVTVDVTTSTTGVFVNTTGELTAFASAEELGSGELSLKGIVEPLSCGFATAALEVPVEFLAKVFTNDPVLPGGAVDLQFSLQNPDRDNAATDIAFTDPLPGGLTAVPPFDTGSCGGSLTGTTTLAYSGGSLGPGASCTFSVTLTAPGAVGTYTNTTTAVTAEIAGESVTGNVATDDLVVSIAPVLTKTFLDDPVAPGDTVTLRFTIFNPSPTSQMTDIAFNDNLTAQLDGLVPMLPPVFNDCGATVSSFTILVDDHFEEFLSVTGGMLAPMATCTIDIDVLVPATDPVDGTPTIGSFPNTTSDITATLDGMTVTGRPASDSLEVTTAPELIKTFLDDPIAPGTDVDLKFSLVHGENAPAPATEIAFTDDLSVLDNVAPAGTDLTGVVVNGSPNYCPPPADDEEIAVPCDCTGAVLDGTPSMLEVTVPRLDPLERCTFIVPVRVPSDALPGTYTNTTSEVTAMVSGKEATNSPASDDLIVAGLSLVKSFLDDPVLPGGLVTLEFVLTNTSPDVTATQISFTDNLGAIGPEPTATLVDLAAVDPVPDPASTCDGTLAPSDGGRFLTYANGSLDPGESCFMRVKLLVPPGSVLGDHTNTTSSVTAVFGGATVTVDPATDHLDVETNVLGLTKSFTDDPVAPGGTVTLELTLTNTLVVQTATGVNFEDNLGAALPGLMLSGVPENGCGASIAGTSDLTISGITLAAEASCTIRLPLKLPGTIPFGTPVFNVTSGVEGDVGGIPVTGDPAQDQLLIDFMTFSKEFDGPTVAGGSPILTFTIGNLDPSLEVSDIKFGDSLDAVLPGLTAILPPGGVDNVCGPGSRLALAGPSFLTLTGGVLGPGESCSFDVMLQVPSPAPLGTFTNTTSDLLTDGLRAAGPATATLEVLPEALKVDMVATVAGELEECDAVSAPISVIRVTLKGALPLLGADDPASYLLLGAGPDGDFATAACAGGAAGDDVPIEIVSLSLTSVDPVTVTAGLGLGGALDPGLYRLLVCDTITDGTDRALDGDGDTVPGGDFVLPFFRADPFNRFANGHFDDCPVTLEPWITVVTPPNTVQPGDPGADDSEGSPLSASARAAHAADEPSTLAQCVPAEGGVTYDLRARVRFNPVMALAARFEMTCEFFAAIGCTGASLGPVAFASLLEDEGGAWIFVEHAVAAPGGAASALCDFAVESGGGGDAFDAFFDGLFVGSDGAIFADGFESGDVSAWSSAVP